MPFFDSNCSDKGFALSLDALLGVLLLIAFMSVAILINFERDYSAPVLSLDKTGRDALVTLDENGTVFSLLDENLSTASFMDSIEQQVVSFLPFGTHYHLEAEQFDYNAAQCISTQVFEECFSSALVFPSRGSILPTDKTVSSQQKTFFRKGSQSYCSIGETISLQSQAFPPARPFSAFFSGDFENPLNRFWRFSPSSDANIVMQSSVTPSGTVECDQDIRVDLSVDLNVGGTIRRKPLDMMYIYDKSKSMDQCAIANGADKNFSLGSIGNGEWQLAQQFTLTDANAFDVLVQWNNACGSDCPKVVLNSPLDVNYGSGYSALNPAVCSASAANYYENASFDYLAIPSVLSGSGTWKVYVKKNGSVLDYNVSTKIIRNSKVNNNGDVVPHNEPISKIGTTKVSIIMFNGEADWNAATDQFGLSRLGRETGQTQEKSAVELGLNNTHNNSVNAHVKGITAISVNESAMGLAIQKTTDELLTGPKANPNAAKVEILLSDGTDTGTTNLSAELARAYDHNITIYTIGFGTDANQALLQSIADSTGGKFYYAFDENRLSDLLQLISTQIGLLAVQQGTGDQNGLSVSGANLFVPILEGMHITNFDGGTLLPIGDQNFIHYFVGNLGFQQTHWTGFFVFHYDCNNSVSCMDENRILPPVGTVLEWMDANGVPQDPLDWNAHSFLFVKYRDLTLSVLNADATPNMGIWVDLNGINAGYLGSNSTVIEVLLDNPLAGTVLGSVPVSSFACGAKETGCLLFNELFFDMDIPEQGRLFAVINRDQSIPECFNNNVVPFNCAATQSGFVVVKLWVWR